MSSQSTRRRRHAFVLMAAGAAAVLAGALVIAGISDAARGPAAGASHAAAVPKLGRVAATALPAKTTCTVAFTGDHVALAGQRQRIGALYADLPIPDRSGYAFAGWYRTAGDAASLAQTARVNGAGIVDCPSGSETLYGAWMTRSALAKQHVQVPILMYHQFTTKPGGEHNRLRLNFDYIGDFEKNMAYLSAKRFYLPTWDELDAFIDGRLYLPHRSVVVTDDDAAVSWEKLAVPVVTRHKVMTTSFVITSRRHARSPSLFVLQRSHTDAMHSAGADGRGKMVNFTVPQIVADLDRSAKVLGVTQVLAYPFGDFNARAEAGLRKAGFAMAVTTRNGYVHAGSDKLELPRVRMSYGMTMRDFINAVG